MNFISKCILSNIEILFDFCFYCDILLGSLDFGERLDGLINTVEVINRFVRNV